MKTSNIPTNSPSELKISLYRKLCRKKWFQIARPIIVVGIVVLLIYILTVLGVFQIKKFENSNELKHTQDLSVLTSQYIGQGYFALNLNELEQDIQKSDKYVKSVSAEKVFPNKVRLVIQEYEPMSCLEYKDVCYIFSQEGLILQEMIEYEDCFLENGIKLTTNQNIIAEGRLIFDKELLEIVLVLKKFGWEVSNVNFKENVLEIGDGQKVAVIEINQEYMTQLSKLYLILEKVNIEGIEYESLDLRFERPVMKLK